MDGVIVVDKPAGITSHDAVQRLRRLTGTRRIGHLGTLDPLATGVLPMAVGKATRLSQFFLGHDREYEAVIRVGFATDSYDRTGAPLGEDSPVAFDDATIETVLERFRGEIDQIPPPVSAKKVGGKRAYKLARAQAPVELPPARIRILQLHLLSVDHPRFTVHVQCSKGTYIRSLAHDIGEVLGCGAHIDELRRLTVGEFSIDLAWSFEALAELADSGRLHEALVPPDRILPEIPVRRVDAVTAGMIGQGRDFRINYFSTAPPSKRVKAVDPDGRLVAIGELKLPPTYHPVVVF